MNTRELCLGIVLCPIAGIASAAPLTVVNVSAPEINCVFETDCTIVITDTIGTVVSRVQREPSGCNPEPSPDKPVPPAPEKLATITASI